ncbi:hypothetical protein DWV16_17690 [Anaerotruncus sp. AF02-27]|nr:hypothetical protein DWV16_17690 [Anaerotruncus sp. AF02-27]
MAMRRKQKIAGFDIGTSSLKVTLADSQTGKITDNLKYDYAGYRELAPGVMPVKVYEETVLTALSELLQTCELVGMALTTQMYSVCEVVDGEIVAWQWNSLWKRCPHKEPDFAHQLQKSGCRTDTIFGAYKVAATDSQKRTGFLPYGLKEHLIAFLTGELATDYTTASASGFFDIEKHDWNRPFVESLGLNIQELPKALPHNASVGTLRRDLLPGLREGILLVPGLGDGPSASWACRDVSNFCGNVGTSMAARVFTGEPDLCETHGLWNYAVDAATYLTGGISSNSCSVLNWAQRFGLDVDAPLADTNDVIFLPWLHGERMPYWSSDLRGSFLGLQIGDSPATLAAAVVKGVAFTFARMGRVLAKKANGPLVLAGGGTNIPALVGLIAGCMEEEIALLEDGGYLCSTGAVLSAGDGLGIKVDPQMRIGRTIRPDGSFIREYENWLSQAKELAQFYNEKIQ